MKLEVSNKSGRNSSSNITVINSCYFSLEFFGTMLPSTPNTTSTRAETRRPLCTNCLWVSAPPFYYNTTTTTKNNLNFSSSIYLFYVCMYGRASIDKTATFGNEHRWACDGANSSPTFVSIWG